MGGNRQEINLPSDDEISGAETAPSLSSGGSIGTTGRVVRVNFDLGIECVFEYLLPTPVPEITDVNAQRKN
jgi:hypothetical protein